MGRPDSLTRIAILMRVDGSLLGAVQEFFDGGRRLGLLLIDEAYDAGDFAKRSVGAGLAHQSRPQPSRQEPLKDWKIKNVRYHQQRVVQFCATMGIPAWLVEIYHGHLGGALPSHLDPNLASSDTRTLTQLRALLPPTTTIIRKGMFNAFDDDARPDLHGSLQAEGIQDLIVMGFSSQMCVYYTVVGGRKIARDGKCEGALTLGYQVLSSDLVVRPQPAPWKDEAGVLFYQEL